MLLRLLEELDALPLGQRDVGLLPCRTPADVPSHAAALAEEARRAHPLDLDAEELLHRLADLDLVRLGLHAQHDLVAGLGNERALLGDDRAADDVGRLHAPAPMRPASCSSAARVTSRFR